MATTIGLVFEEKPKAQAQKVAPVEKPFKQLGAEKQIEYVKARDWTNNIDDLKDLLDFAKPTAKPIIEKGIKILEDEAQFEMIKAEAVRKNIEIKDDDTVESLSDRIAGAESGD